MGSTQLRFLADESCDFAIVRELRTNGYDVHALAQETTRTVDSEVMALAAVEQRILLTEDKDFGWLAFVARSAESTPRLSGRARWRRRGSGRRRAPGS